MSKKERVAEIGVLRGLAFAAVVLQHSIAHYSIVPGVTLADGVLLAILLLAAKFAVPVFVFITGLVLFYNYDGKLSFGTFLSKRFKDIIVPYIIWSAVFEAGNVLAAGGAWSWDTLLLYGQKLLTGKTSYHLWYIVMIIQCYLLFPVLRKAVRAIAAAIPAKVAPAALAATGLLYVGLMYCIGPISRMFEALDIPVLTPMFTVYADRNVLYFLFYFILGASAGMNIGRWNEWVRKAGWMYWSLFALLTGILLFRLVGTFQTDEGLVIRFHSVSLLRPLMAVYCIVLIFAAYRMAMAIIATAPLIARRISWLGMVSYGAYLMHPLMLRFTYLPDQQLFAAWNVTVRTLMSFVVCSLLSAGAAWLLSRLPLGRWTVGFQTRRPIPNTRKQTGLPG
ncbi:acyltransferase [Paenibacillus sp. P96]|uniref:Acyltransferase n=1 Tax=Paenibacillus zeirhizosphaerae TaxID=2987519 RepID=A0ABT9FRR6_9BACL|nr:acyltransferase [Paenibacillus sp. P96]MDP4097418.1 acyltransferase [Paenibacillus sp. P96]